ncbi:MAG: ATP-binding cassette domain-containing protein [Crocinitomicaceae bacterium]
MLKLINVGLKYDDWVLKGISTEFESSQIYGIVGQSGAGKTSLLKIISAFQDVTEGDVLFNEEKLIGPNQKLVPGYDDIQLVNQDFALEPYHTVEQNIREKVLSRPKEVQVELINEYLDLVELNGIRQRKAIILSGGEKQRLAIARALANEPRVLLLDEPFVHLDQRLKYKILNYLKELNRIQGTTIVIVSHDGVDLMGFASQIIYLKDGRVKRNDLVSTFYYQPKDISEAELMGQINAVEVSGEIKLFRPNEYRVVESNGFEVQFIKSLDTGFVVLNYFKTKDHKEILLSSLKPLEGVKRIVIDKIL